MIEVNNLTKRYGNHVAVDGLNFSVEKGQIYGFLGPNGAGKSTTMNIITGYLAATEGEVLIDGHDILKEPEKAKSHIGYLPEQPPLYQDMTVEEYLNFVAELRKLPESERAESVEKIEETLGLSDVSGRLIKNLSKGYKQRVGFAQALIGMPEILILDEPTVGLDPKQIIEIRDLIKLLGQKHTIILSSHILSEVSAICDHIMIISEGKLVASDTPENLMKMMQPVTTLNITVIADTGACESAMNSIEGLESYDLKPGRETGTFEIFAKYKSETDLRRNISEMLFSKGCIIIQMTASSASLEDIFLELTENEAEDASEAQLEDNDVAYENEARAATASAYDKEAALLQEQACEEDSEEEDDSNI
ncbi:MAG: ABC transporter ATP-binding protein [Anaerovoracaceae bacterium]